MKCKKCSTVVEKGAEFCPECGAPLKKKGARKWIIIISLVLIVAMIAAIIVIVTVKSPLSADKANGEYLDLLKKNRADITLFERGASVNGVAFYDINGTGINDMVYVTGDPSGSGAIQLNIAFDDDNKIKTDSIKVGSLFEMYRDKKSGHLHLFTRDSEPISGKRIYIDRLYELKLDSGNIDVTNEKNRYYDADHQTVSFTPPEQGDEDFSGYENDFITAPGDEGVILIAPAEAVPGIPTAQDGYTDISVDVQSAMDALSADDAPAADVTDAAEQTDAPQTEVPQTEAPTEAQTVDIDPAAMPDSLGRFLYKFNWIYHSDDSSQHHEEFDCTDLSNCYNRLAKQVANGYSCIHLADFPNIEVTAEFRADKDPLGRFKGMGYAMWKKDDAVWVLSNIFHVPDADILPMIDIALEDAGQMYEYTDGGVTYLCSILGGKGDPPYEAVYDIVRYDGERYYIIYDYSCIADNVDDSVRYYTEVGEVEIDGVKYWTMYKHSEVIPELP